MRLSPDLVSVVSCHRCLLIHRTRAREAQGLGSFAQVAVLVGRGCGET